MCPVRISLLSLVLASTSTVLLSTANNVPVPVFKSFPTTIKTSIHDTVLLPCYVENLGVNGIRWWKDERLLWDTSDEKVTPPDNIRVFPNQTLEVADLKDSDTGDYICQVVRPDPWNPINQVHAIEVMVPPNVKTVPESGELEVELGHEVIMGCIVTGVPTPVVSWSYKGKDMELINNRATLRFKATDRKMSGNYQCTATNGVGDSAAATIRLKILYRPEVGAERLWIHTAPGERAELSCTVFSDPESKVEWFHEDKAVDLGDGRIMAYREGEKHKLIIKRVISADLGFFTCRATNLFGRGQQSVHLSGIANPAAFKRGPKQSSNHNYTLIWEVESYSAIIEYKLLFKKHQGSSEMTDWTEIIVPADSSSPGPIHSQSYTLWGLQESTVYEASVLSRNKFGWSRPSHIFRFATKGADLLTDLSVKEDDLQELQEQDEAKEQVLRDFIEKKIVNIEEADASPMYEGNSWTADSGFSSIHTFSWGLSSCLLATLVQLLH
ncbi:neurotrimin-like isoform X3 [Homalodisca vitripennis]|uniref:neurotrimin-like isoform X3 n=1 Tax=Homalodisca vitripennis TaxID=197043 RepID=UPI001EEB9BCA|nr:neurotrimin-like isoform X3 [Homalodisca vitripennis]